MADSEGMSLRDVIVDALDEEVHYAGPVIDRLVDEVDGYVRSNREWDAEVFSALVADRDARRAEVRALDAELKKGYRVHNRMAGLVERYKKRAEKAKREARPEVLGEVVSRLQPPPPWPATDHDVPDRGYEAGWRDALTVVEALRSEAETSEGAGA